MNNICLAKVVSTLGLLILFIFAILGEYNLFYSNFVYVLLFGEQGFNSEVITLNLFVLARLISF